MKKYQDNINLKIPVKLRYLPFVLDSTKAFAKIVGFDEKQTNEILLGIEEAVVNVIEHAFTISDDAVFELVLQETALDFILCTVLWMKYPLSILANPEKKPV
ncbi:MAG: ATP-binding protein [Desulforegulaceae bacterium]|nr:ATP-binding protein [Desulforegulaceae bacterium]